MGSAGFELRRGPNMDLHPHDHRMWAVIEIYGGREDNKFYRRSKYWSHPAWIKITGTKDTVPLREAVIHSVSSPSIKLPALFMSVVGII
ncbi:MAG: hypothetical protein BMS9Abin01_2842 [Gammaproteobacteria bacterium]|nr:MAG: hypothetical protein BMS9Abin01_2842 [Gammaproteobacteria bacterium]